MAAASRTLKTHHGAFAALVLGGLMLSTVLAPRDSEMALIYFKTEQYDQALRLYGSMYQQGNRSVAVVMPLAQVYQRLGEATASISILEDYGIEHPNDPKMLDLLSDAYQSDQRGYDQLRVLERLARIKPTEKRLRELSHLYNYYGEYQRQIDTLFQLLELAPGEGRYYLDLAQMLASQDRLAEAADTLGLMLQRNVKVKDSEYIGLQIKLLLANNQGDDALAWARDAIEANPKQISEYLSVFQDRKRPDLALSIARTNQNAVIEDAALLAQYVEILMETGGNQVALEELRTLRLRGLLPKSMRTTLVDLAFEQKLVELALAVASKMDPERLPRWLLGGLLESALLLEDQSFITTTQSQLDQQFLKDNPVLAARLALANRDKRGFNHWLEVAGSKTDLSREQRSDLAHLYLKLGMTDRAMTVLRGLIGQQEVDAELLAEMAPLYLRAGRIKEGLSVFERLRRKRDEAPIEKAWAILASASGMLRAMTYWLESSVADTLTDEELDTLYYAAADRKHYELALLLARKKQPRMDPLEGTLLLATTLLNAGKPLEAMGSLRAVVDRAGPEVQNLWQNALFAAWEKGADVRDDLLGHWDKRLREAKLSPPQRRQIAFQMLDLGEKGRAETVFRQLAAGGSADGKDMQQLLYLWGPYPQGERLDWLLDQTRSSPPQQREGWLGVLENAGATTELATLIEDIPATQRSAREDHLLLNAFSSNKQLDKLDKELLRQARATTAVRPLVELARRAREEDRGRVEQQIWERVLMMSPDHAQALRHLGLAAFVAENRQQAREYLEHYLSLHDPDWETVYFLAETLTNLGLQQRALPEYERALELLDGEASLSKFMRVAQAQIMHRTQRSAAALEAYEQLYLDFPEDADLRADYIGMLLENGEMRRARTVLEGE